MEIKTVKNTETKETANIPAADLEWFLENGWEEVAEAATASKKK